MVRSLWIGHGRHHVSRLVEGDVNADARLSQQLAIDFDVIALEVALSTRAR